jgi:hypothetical protein
MKLLLFAGAGTSAELNVPTMRGMVTEFRDHLKDSGRSPELIQRMDERLRVDRYDIENLIEELDHLAQGSSIAPYWGAPADDRLSGQVGVIRAEAEWFIQHVCERVESARAARLWMPTLRTSTSHDITIATTKAASENN